MQKKPTPKMRREERADLDGPAKTVPKSVREPEKEK